MIEGDIDPGQQVAPHADNPDLNGWCDACDRREHVERYRRVDIPTIFGCPRVLTLCEYCGKSLHMERVS